MTEPYDAIVVGARCAGSPTAMLLARKGHRVLMVDRATFPSDTLSSHLAHPRAVAALARWGLLDQVVATGCPPIERYTFDFGEFAISGAMLPVEGITRSYAPRRIVLDKLLVDAAVAAGVEMREGFTVEEVLVDEDGRVTGIRGRDADGASVVEHATVVVGAEGRTSAVAKAARPETYNERDPYAAIYYAYWSGVPTEGFEVYVRPDRAFAAIPTNDDQTLVLVAWPRSEFSANRGDVEGNYLKTLELAPEFAARVRAGRRESRWHGTSGVANFFRTPYGPGWALVGDAGYQKDPCTAQGISDGFLQAESLATALDDSLRGRRAYDDALGEFHRTRDEHALPMFEFTCGLAGMEPPPPEMAQLLAAVAGNQDAMDGFVSMVAGTIPVPEFLAPENVARIMAAAKDRAVALSL